MTPLWRTWGCWPDAHPPELSHPSSTLQTGGNRERGQPGEGAPSTAPPAFLLFQGKHSGKNSTNLFCILDSNTWTKGFRGFCWFCVCVMFFLLLWEGRSPLILNSLCKNIEKNNPLDLIDTKTRVLLPYTPPHPRPRPPPPAPKPPFLQRKAKCFCPVNTTERRQKRCF